VSWSAGVGGSGQGVLVGGPPATVTLTFAGGGQGVLVGGPPATVTLTFAGGGQGVLVGGALSSWSLTIAGSGKGVLVGGTSTATATGSGGGSFAWTSTTPTGELDFTGTKQGVLVGGAIVDEDPELTGEVRMWTTSTAPSGWLKCDGAAVSRTTYAALFAVIGTTYGMGNGTTTFNLPSFTGRVPVGPDPSGTILPQWAPNLGGTPGEDKHTQTVAEMPVHKHAGDSGLSFLMTTGGPNASLVNVGVAGSFVANTANAGSGTAFNIVQPTCCVLFIIKT
jgi:microcystin-dependent protein